MALLVTRAHLITMAPGVADCGLLPDGWMLVEHGRITATGAGDPPAVPGARVLDVGGAFVAPGFVSAHSHLFTSGARGLGADETLYGWCDEMLGLMGGATPETYYWTTLHGALDFIAGGTTTAFDFTDPRISWDRDGSPRFVRDGVDRSADAADAVAPSEPELRPLQHQLAQIDGKAAAGIRFLNAASLDDAIGTDDEVLERFGAMVEYTRSLDRSFALDAAIMGAVQWSDRPNAAALEVAAMRRYGVINQAHFLETREAVEAQRTKFAAYEQAGALGPDLIFGHFIQTTPQIIATAAAGGASMSWQPASNGRLASGVADLPAILAAGMPVGMGLDDQACTDIADPWQNMRMGMALVRAATGRPASMLPEQVLRLHTEGSARILGLAGQVGALTTGAHADFLVVDPRSPDVGPLWRPVRSYVLACGQRNLKQVYIGGELVAEDGVSLNPLAADASAAVHRLMPIAAERTGRPPR
ncbi:amidohydrolase family protein [uncultured Amnibacterium sp.]|uniref:amidohydrolase family protein n=1 Tax=uncultured Amnibacterium sp. TaxID=1631851 RepID=UPI0035C9BA68